MRPLDKTNTKMWRNFDTSMFRLNGGAAQIRYLSSSNIFPSFEKKVLQKKYALIEIRTTVNLTRIFDLTELGDRKRDF